MNMKKTFAGAMAGALAVSAMATSASASIPGPGEYTIDLTVDGNAYATVQFTFDGDYMLTGNVLELGVTDTSGLFNFNKIASLTAQFVGSKGTDTQTLKYTSGWGDVDYYTGSWSFNGFKIGLNTMVDPNGWGVSVAKQGLYTDKYATVKEALAVKMADGNKKYPESINPAGEDLDKVFFDKIVVTAKVPMAAVKNLSELNAQWGEKGKVVASIKGITPIDIYEMDNSTAVEDAAVATAKAAVAAAETAVTTAQAKVKDLKNASLVYELSVTSGDTTAYDALDASLKLGSTAAYAAAISAAEDDVTAAKDVLADAKATLTAAEAAAKAAVGTYVAVDVLTGVTATGETLFTKSESERVGPKSGIFVADHVDDAANNNAHLPLSGTVKTVAADIGAFKPDALRQIRDAIADNEGVTLTFTAKNEFDDAAYRNWLNKLSGLNVDWTSANKVWGTDNVKDSYEVWGESMFTGAIVLNRDFSKQFSQSGLVDWGTNTITFDWDELTEGRFYDASVVVHSLEILSTQNVEWVSCTVTVPEQNVAEPVDPSQPNVENPNVIDPTPVETTTAEVITAAPETTAAAPETTAAAPVAPVTNPTTGNAPVALAVIPVALAAAAIVAKKRG